MERIPVQSSSIVSIGYETESLTLEIEFIKSGVYQYSGVPLNIYEELMNSSSKGSYFDQNIRKGGYAYGKIG